MRSGLISAALAYAMWGLFPLYFHQLRSVAPLEIVLHRTVWSLAFLIVVLLVLRRGGALLAALREPRRAALFGTSALLLAANWLLYVWAVNNGRVIDSSLGYFINPLVNVLLGVLVLHERLRRVQWVAIGVAAAGVVWLTVRAGELPWIGLVIAATFGLYGLLRKTAPLGALDGLALETLLLAPLAAPLLAWWTLQGTSALATADATVIGWLLLGGPLTAVPLLLFAAGARRIPLATLGLLQYIGPTLQLALGVWWFDEPFEPTKLVGFGLIWAALALYSAEGAWRATRARAPAPPR
jgi:chloramphenicol-sensitive protein RarD